MYRDPVIARDCVVDCFFGPRKSHVTSNPFSSPVPSLKKESGLGKSVLLFL